MKQEARRVSRSAWDQAVMLTSAEIREPAFEGTRATLEEARRLAGERRGGCHYVTIYFDGKLVEMVQS